MEKRTMGFVIERLINNDTLSFKIRVSEETTCNVMNCHIASTDSDALAEGVECYIGNIELNGYGGIIDVSAHLWIYPDNSCVIVYKD